MIVPSACRPSQPDRAADTAQHAVATPRTGTRPAPSIGCPYQDEPQNGNLPNNYPNATPIKAPKKAPRKAKQTDNIEANLITGDG